MKLYICPICKNLIVMVNDSGVNPSCCNKPMVELHANTVDAAHEKHVPVVTLENNKVKVEVGSVIHPMSEEHYIDFIILETNKGYQVHKLNKNETPKTTFEVAEDEKPIAVYEYCNLHGLWKTTI